MNDFCIPYFRVSKFSTPFLKGVYEILKEEIEFY